MKNLQRLGLAVSMAGYIGLVSLDVGACNYALMKNRTLPDSSESYKLDRDFSNEISYTLKLSFALFGSGIVLQVLGRKKDEQPQ